MEQFGKKLNHADVTFKLKHVFCHDPGCRVCAQEKGHGPYWHATYEEHGQTHTVFLGREFNPLELNSDSHHQENADHVSESATGKSTSANKAENHFDFRSKPTQPIQKNMISDSNNNRKRPDVPIPPSKFDFERDLNTLKNTFRADNLKSVYRKLTKKYHPDRYPGIGHINTWMAEINGQYSQKKRHFRM